MKTRDRWYVLMASYTWSFLGLFLTGSWTFFLISFVALIYLIMGYFKVKDHA